MTMKTEKVLTDWRDDLIIEIEKIAEKLAEAVSVYLHHSPRHGYPPPCFYDTMLNIMVVPVYPGHDTVEDTYMHEYLRSSKRIPIALSNDLQNPLVYPDLHKNRWFWREAHYLVCEAYNELKHKNITDSPTLHTWWRQTLQILEDYKEKRFNAPQK